MLADKLGWIDVDAMLDAISPQQFAERMAYHILLKEKQSGVVQDEQPMDLEQAEQRLFSMIGV